MPTKTSVGNKNGGKSAPVANNSKVRGGRARPKSTATLAKGGTIKIPIIHYPRKMMIFDHIYRDILNNFNKGKHSNLTLYSSDSITFVSQKSPLIRNLNALKVTISMSNASTFNITKIDDVLIKPSIEYKYRGDNDKNNYIFEIADTNSGPSFNPNGTIQYTLKKTKEETNQINTDTVLKQKKQINNHVYRHVYADYKTFVKLAKKYGSFSNCIPKTFGYNPCKSSKKYNQDIVIFLTKDLTNVPNDQMVSVVKDQNFTKEVLENPDKHAQMMAYIFRYLEIYRLTYTDLPM